MIPTLLEMLKASRLALAGFRSSTLALTRTHQKHCMPKKKQGSLLSSLDNIIQVHINIILFVQLFYVPGHLLSSENKM